MRFPRELLQFSGSRFLARFECSLAASAGEVLSELSSKPLKSVALPVVLVRTLHILLL